MARAITEKSSGTVLRGFDIIRGGQILSYRCGQVIEVDGGLPDAIEASDAFVAWDGEVPPHSKNLPVNDLGLPPGLY